MNNSMITSSEKQFFGKVGKAYGRVFKAMFFFLILSLIVTGITVAQADPQVSRMYLDAGEAMYIAPFYVDAADDFQFFFGIENNNYDEYNTQNEDVDWYEYSEQMEWKVQLIVEYSEDRAFTTSEQVADFSGEINVIEVSLQPGFHRILVRNLDQSNIQVIVGHSSVNLGLVVMTGIFWAIFGITVGIFGFMIHVGIWILIIYAVVKLVLILNDDRHKPQTVIYPEYATSATNSQPSNQDLS